MRVCYVLTTTGWDRYAAMAWVSASALRRLHPDWPISLITDDDSRRAMERCDAPILQVVDQIAAVDTSCESRMMASRFLKTSMRSMISGDFIFLDVDALPVRSLEKLSAISASIGAALERNLGLEDAFAPPGYRKVFERLNWRWPPRRYFNSGVMVVRDTEQSRSLFGEWHRRWQRSVGIGSPVDQPALNSALDDLNFEVDVLSPEYNSMILWYPWRFRTCHIAHFFESNAFGSTVMAHLVTTALAERRMDWSALDRCVREAHPWGPNPEAWQFVRSRQPVRASLAKIRTLIGRRAVQMHA